MHDWHCSQEALCSLAVDWADDRSARRVSMCTQTGQCHRNSCPNFRYPFAQPAVRPQSPATSSSRSQNPAMRPRRNVHPGSQPMGRVNLLCTTTLFALVVDCVRVRVCAFHAPAAGSLHKASYREPAIHERESSFVCSRTYTCGGVLIYLVHAQSEGHELLHCKSHGRLRAERIKYPLLCNMNDCHSCRQETQNKYLCSGPMRVHVYGNMSPFLEAVQYHWPAEATTEHIESQVNDGRTANPS